MDCEHAVTVIYRLEINVFSMIGPRAIKNIEPPELLACLRRIEARGHLELARRTTQICGQVWRYAVATGRAQRDITADLRGAIAHLWPEIFQPSWSRPDSASSCGTWTITPAFSSPGRPFGFRPLCFCGLAICGKRNGRTLTWPARFGGSAATMMKG